MWLDLTAQRPNLTCEKFEMLTEPRDIARGSFRPTGPARELSACGEFLYVRKFAFDFAVLCVARHALRVRGRFQQMVACNLVAEPFAIVRPYRRLILENHKNQSILLPPSVLMSKLTLSPCVTIE
jgi:hypothetical protein